MAGLRCHLLIGPPASGKTTTAALLAPLLQAEVFSTDRIREELYGDAAIQGHWPEVEARLHESIRQAVGARRAGIERLTRLMERSGGIYFGEEVDLQEQLATANPQDCRKLLVTVRFRCTLPIYRFLREGLQRYPLEQLRLSKPLPGDRWRQPAHAPLVLEPQPGSSHPFPVEIDLPPWTVARDVDFRRWLFGYGAEVVVEAPEALRLEHQQRGQAMAALYDA